MERPRIFALVRICQSAEWSTEILNGAHIGYDKFQGNYLTAELKKRAGTSSESVFVLVTNTKMCLPLNPSKYSSWLRLTRIIASVNRLVGNCSKHKEHITSGELLTN